MKSTKAERTLRETLLFFVSFVPFVVKNAFGTLL